MLKVKRKFVTTLLPKDMNVIPGDAPSDWHAQAASRMGGPNVTGHDSSKEPVADPEGLSGVPMHRLGDSTQKKSEKKAEPCLP